MSCHDLAHRTTMYTTGVRHPEIACILKWHPKYLMFSALYSSPILKYDVFSQTRVLAKFELGIEELVMLVRKELLLLASSLEEEHFLWPQCSKQNIKHFHENRSLLHLRIETSGYWRIYFGLTLLQQKGKIKEVAWSHGLLNVSGYVINNSKTCSANGE